MTETDTETSALDLPAVAGRVRSMFKAVGLDGTVFAERVGVPYSTMRSYISGSRPPSAEFLVGCYRAFGFLPAWLLAGEGPMSKDGLFTAPPAQESDLVPVPRLNVRASAGRGQVQEEAAEYAIGAISVSRAWLAQRRLSASKLRAIEVRGNSMQGVLSDGDLVVIDVADTTPRSGYVYVLRQGDELQVKYCQQLPGGILRVSSANPAFPPYEVDLAKSADVSVVGRVVASMHDW